MNLRKAIEKALKLRARYQEQLMRVGKFIASVIEEVTGLDVWYAAGWEGQSDVLCFMCNDRDVMSIAFREDKLDFVPLDKTLHDVLEEFDLDEFYFTTPYGVWLTKGEARKIKKKLREILSQS